MALRRAVFGAAALLGAFLLFQVQPLVGRRILPAFGGGTAVWTTCLLFFQAVLFAGYAYAYAVERLTAGARTLVHLALVGASLAALAAAPSGAGAPEAAANPTWPILKLLAASVGVPCLLLSSTGPLVQAWAARAEPGRSPYRLYALSNAGSLAALLSYPFLIEPHWGLRSQASAWSAAFAVFAALSAAGVASVRRTPALRAAPEEERPPGRGVRSLWVLLPAAGSALLTATTNELSQDVAVLPFLWVLPLAAYLVSFIVAFDRPDWVKPELLAPVTAALGIASAAAYYARPTTPALLALAVALPLAALLGACLLCHGALARLKPAPARLTGYYLAIAGGGALGSALVTLGAPLAFSTLFEWKLGIALSTAGALAACGWAFRGFFRAHLNVAALALVLAGVGLAFQGALMSTYARRLESSRTFYGAVTVDEGEARDLTNGRVLHGRQFIDERRRRLPTTYYGESSGVGRALGLFRSRPDLRVGVVGLGAGTLAAYVSRPPQSVRFYEINPDVARIARRWFTYLDDCPGRVEVVLGDARLSLEREAPHGFHVLALDAFSGHTVPTHLLTVEAMRIYARHLSADGIVALHVSNRFLRLAPVARGAARACGLDVLRIDEDDDAKGLDVANTWVLAAKDPDALRGLRAAAAEDRDGEDVVWTDDASDLFSILRPRATP
jgi:hypothetical protein